jgi:hypothetical protein
MDMVVGWERYLSCKGIRRAFPLLEKRTLDRFSGGEEKGRCS